MPRTLTIGLSVGTESLTATWRDGGVWRDWTAPLSAGPTGQPLAESLRSALNALRLTIGGRRRVGLAVAVLPPLARLRRIELPRMSNEERRLAVSRTAERYFLGVSEPALCAIEAHERGSAAAAAFVAAGVSSSLVSDLSSIATDLGWAVERVVPAHAAWSVAALSRFEELRRGNAEVLVDGHAESTLISLDFGKISHVRRLRVGETSSRVSPAEGRSKSLATGFAGQSVALIAARNVAATRSFELVSDDERRTRYRRETRVIRWLTGIGAACLLASAVSYRWGLTRELESVAAQRAVLRSRVNRAMAARDTLTNFGTMLGATASLEQSAPRWSAVLSRIAVALPQDATLIGLRADGDSIVADGQASNGAAIFAALRSAPGVIGVRPTAPIRQELTAGQNAVERWTLSLRVAHDAAVRGRR